MGLYEKVLKRYSTSNPEKFNREFILAKNDKEILSEITNIFKSLEIIKEIHIESISMNSS